eukprot:6414217-Karenia_brevis.AAC.1
MAKFPYGKKTKFGTAEKQVKEEEEEKEEKEESEEDPEPAKSLVEDNTAAAFRRLEDKDKLRLTCQRCQHEKPPGTNVMFCGKCGFQLIPETSQIKGLPMQLGFSGQDIGPTPGQTPAEFEPSASTFLLWPEL